MLAARGANIATESSCCVSALAYCAGGYFASAGFGKNYVSVWNDENYCELTRLSGHTAPVLCLAAESAEQTQNLLASGDESGCVILWDIDNFALLRIVV